jgi:hypothetical protein
MFRYLSALFALAVVPLGACAGGEPVPAADPLVVIVGPKAFLSFELRDEREGVIWRLVADEAAPLSEVFYGEIPAGFRQEVPAGGEPPRPLLFGEWLTLESVTPLRLFRHEGFVVSGQRLSIDRWEMKLHDRPTPAEVDATREEP